MAVCQSVPCAGMPIFELLSLRRIEAHAYAEVAFIVFYVSDKLNNL